MNKITIETTINAPLRKVWEHWNKPESIKGWAFASDTWECPYAENDLRVGGRFLTRMSAKDGSSTFDFTGEYTAVSHETMIEYIMDKADGESQHRVCEVVFMDLGNGTTKVKESFDPEQTNSEELQREGWSAILKNFKEFVESN